MSFEHKVLLVQIASSVSGKPVDAKDEFRVPDHSGVYEAARLNQVLAEVAADGWELPFQPLPTADMAHLYLFLRRELR